jgi:pSer/pThr/pTyr-binding forkhead associated (FHA) protein
MRASSRNATGLDLDLGSTNGTYVNGEQVEPRAPEETS